MGVISFFLFKRTCVNSRVQLPAFTPGSADTLRLKPLALWNDNLFVSLSAVMPVSMFR